jgi:homoaconitase/3-isopropylmalate dehydratase large subunit
MSLRTMYQKIWDSHVVSEPAGQPALLYIDRHLIHEGTCPQAFAGLKATGSETGQLRMKFIDSATFESASCAAATGAFACRRRPHS